MKFGNNDVLEVTIFDEKGTVITTLDTLKSSNLFLDNEGVFRLVVEDALLNDAVLKFIGKHEKDSSSDFDKYLKKQKYGTTITFNRHTDKSCKLIGKGILREVDSNMDKEFLFEIPNAVTTTQFEFRKDLDVYNPSTFWLGFIAKPFNDEGDSLRMHIE